MLAAVLFACALEAAQAQTTVVLEAPASESVDPNVPSGSYAAIDYGSGTLETRASSDWTYVRRALTKFDTAGRVPARAVSNSATLTLTARAASAGRTFTATSPRPGDRRRRKGRMTDS